MPKYSAKQHELRGKWRGKPRSRGRQFLMLYRNVKRSQAYHGLSLLARALLIELVDRHDGMNNGMIRLGVREAAYELKCSQGSISNATRELDDAGLVRPTKIGAWRGRQVTEWRLMFYRCDKTGELPVTQWDQRESHREFTERHTKVHVGEHRESAEFTYESANAEKPNE
jgi:DNA-binding transcriptional ArsR family regulator